LVINKPTTLLTPPKQYNIKDIQASIGVGKWFHVLSHEMSEAMQKAAIAGMPCSLAEQVYKEALGTALPIAIKVRERRD